MEYSFAHRRSLATAFIIVGAAVLSLSVGLRTASAANTAPSVTLTPSASSITAGQTISLTWNTVDATSCTPSGFTGSGIYGAVNVAPITSTTYSITCTDGRMQTTATAAIDVTVASSTAPVVTLVANPSTVDIGAVSTLSWTSANATLCSGSGFTANSTNGATNVSPTVTTTYSISCTGTGGTASASVTLNVNKAPTPEPAPAAGVRVRATASLNVRSSAGNSGGPKNVLCTQPAGTLGTITEGPVKASGKTWWNISYDTGCSGWSTQDYLTTKISSLPTSSQLATALSALTSLESQLQGLLQQVRTMIASLR